MFRRITVAAPPENGALINDVIKPAVTHLFRAQIRRQGIIFQCADKGKGSGDIIVGDNQRTVKFFVDVILDRPQLLHNFFVGPPFERAAKVDAD